MQTSARSNSPSQATPTWRAQAAAIVEELFPVCAPDGWDLLLDLRQCLIGGADCTAILDAFLACRARLEADHYLPFYRLRRLLAASLELELGHREATARIRPLRELLQRRHRSMADLRKAIHRDAFEHMLDAPGPLRLVERA